MSKLPDKLSELIRLAQADLKWCEANPNYVINMSCYHEPDGKYCYVCLAGAVMAKTLGANPTVDLSTCDYQADGSTDKLQALSDVTFGCATRAYMRLNDCVFMDVPDEIKELNRETDFPAYDVDREGYHAGLQQLANDLEAIGY